MRRPSPLPSSSEDAGGPESPEPERDAGGSTPLSEADTTPIDVAVPEPPVPELVEGSRVRPPVPELVEGSRVRPPVPELVEGSPPELRLRDVWGAARARRRVLRAEMRRFTGRQRRRRLTWFVSIAALVVLVVGTLAVAYSPLFAVRDIHVVGADLLDETAVEAALSDQVGTPLPLIDESEIKSALVEFPFVQSYTLEARPPDELVVRIVERTPVGLLQSGGQYELVDAAGVVLSTTPDPVPGYAVLTVEGGVEGPAFEAIGQIIRALPEELRSQVTAVQATTRDDVTLTLGETDTQIVWGSPDDSAVKALVLESAMISNPPQDVSVYDLSSPTAIVVG